MNIKKVLILWGVSLMFWGVPSQTNAQAVQLTIVDSIRMALTHSPEIKAVEAEVAKSAWLIKENNAVYLPVFSANHVQTQNGSVSGGSSSDSRSSYIEAKTTLYSGGLNEGLTAQAKELYAGAQYNLAQTKQQIITNTYLAYYNVLQTEKNVGLANDAVQRLAEHLAIVKAQYSEGTVIKSDVLRTEVELAQAKQNHSKAENDYRLADSHLVMLLGLPADQEVTLAETSTALNYAGSVTQAVQTALSERAELKQAYQEEKAAQQGIQIAQSGQLPSVNLSLKKEWKNQDASANDWTAQMAVSFNLFDGNRTKAKIKQAEWETTQKHELLQQKTEKVTLETKEAYFNMQNARTAMEIAFQVVGKAEEDYMIAQVRYQSGIGTNLDVIDAQGALTTAKFNYINARYDYNKYTVQLAQAMGTITEDDVHDKKEAAR
jgi:outer membrane protein